MTDKQEWFDNKKQNLDIYESVLMSEAGCMESILRGNVFFIQRICHDQYLMTCAERDHISKDPLENLRDNFIIMTALIARACIENGMNETEAMRVFTLYSRSLDILKTETDIAARFQEMLLDYCKRMRELVCEQNRSPVVRRTIRYISEHLSEHPVLSDLAEMNNISSGHLSRRFHEETGCGITEWYHRVLTETAGLLIRYTDDSITAISSQLGCSSVSNFIQIFSAGTNRTPNRYRQEFRMNFSRQITAVTDEYKNAQRRSQNIILTGYYLPHETSSQSHQDYRLPDQEYAFYESVLAGDVDAVTKIHPDILTLNNEKTGVLSDDPLTDRKYHFLIIMATLMRLCIEYRLSPVGAYHLSSYYVSRMQEAQNEGQFHQIMDDLVMAFTHEMQNLHTRHQISKPIRQCIEYIYSHTSEKIRTQDLAAITGKSVSWIAHTFPKETGISVKDYVQREKIASAKNLLHYTDLSFAEIADRLSFSSQSHFTLVFHNETGVTPGEWRKKIRASENS